MKKLSEHTLLWRKSAVLGSLWAASEIVLGSFLHNARVPLSGEFLTAIGIAILVAGHRLWPERGLLWRSGLVCAAMKAISPSAVIFGPMIAISMEGLLMETGVRLFGVNPAGYLLGGGLAMSWPLAHKAANLLVYYGPDAINIYLRGVGWLYRYCGFGPGNLWAPLILMFAAYFLAGAASAAAGMRSGKKGMIIPAQSSEKPALKPRGNRENTARSYSVAALIGHILFVSAVMSAGRKTPPAAILAGAVVYAYICVRFYPRAGSLLKRTGVWAGVLAASLLAGLILGSAEAGFYMAIRAFILTVGFAAIGCELTNPSIRRLLYRLGGGMFFETLEYAFSALPGIIAGLPSGRDFARRPLTVLGAAVARAPFLMETLGRPPVFIITGGHGSGKSELVIKLAGILRAAGKKPGGICAAGLWENGIRAGFDLIDLASNRRVPLCRSGVSGAAVTAGKFGFYAEGLSAGASALSPEILSGTDMVFIDEIGFLELDGGGWASALNRLLQDAKHPLILVSRDYLLDRIRAHWKLHSAVVWKTGEVTVESCVARLTAL